MPAPPPRRLDFAMLVVALVGLSDVAYLGVQEARGFSGGCTGFDPAAIAAPTSACGAALSSTYSTFLGVSNVTLGYVFWGLLVVLGVAALVGGAGPALRARQARLALLGVGVVYAAYLTFVLASGRSGGFCGFCFASHVLTFVLAALAAVQYRLSRRP